MTEQQIREITVSVHADQEQGTGFYISPNLILTAYHVVKDADDVTIYINRTVEAMLLDFDRELDVAVLKINENIAISPLCYPYYGFSEAALLIGFIDTIIPPLKGNIVSENNLLMFDVETGKRENYGGLSGAAIIVNGKIAGIAQVQQSNREIHATDLKAISPFLQKHGVLISEEIPFEKELLTNITNLGERYSPKINVKLPIAQIFDGLALNERFLVKNKKVFEKCLKAINEREFRDEIEICKCLTEAKEKLTNLYKGTDWKKQFSAAPFITLVSELNEKLHDFREPFFDFSEKDEAKKRDIEDKRYWLSQSIYALNEYSEYLESTAFQLAEHRCLLLKGDAGMGKSHLLADVAKNQLNDGFCSVLILGNKLYKEDLWKQIRSQMEFDGTKKGFLEKLDAIGKKQGRRVLFLIDALNEGDGKTFWRNELAGFIAELKTYPNIGLGLSVRSSYWKEIVPDNVEKDKTIIQHEHKGFQGNETEAISRFCDYFGLEQPRVPLLSPEFSNPLTLYLLCNSLKETGKKALPEGSNGLLHIYDTYIDAINIKLSHSERLDYDPSMNIVRDALLELAKYSVENKTQRIDLKQANRILDDIEKGYGSTKKLLFELINENIISKEIYDKHDEDDKWVSYEGIRFTFERFSDHIIAKHLLKTHIGKNEPKPHFQKGGFFYNFFQLDNERERHNNIHWYNNGILEALAIQLPEKYNVELFEVFPIIEEDTRFAETQNETLTRAYIESLSWRNPKSIDKEKGLYYLNTTQAGDFDNYVYTLLELTAYPNHPFNSDHIHKWLSKYDMAKRDSYWLKFLRYYDGTADDGNSLIVKRLVDWAWQPNAHTHLNEESVRLAAQTIAWFLSSQKRDLRDKSTKGLICLLDERPTVLLQTLRAFEGIDDLYIAERLYAVAYGCVVRADNPSDFQEIGQYVFDVIFKDGTPPRHVLLRDYARNAIEFLISQNVDIEGEMSKIRPPYQSKMLIIPSEDEIKKHIIPFEQKELPVYLWRAHNMIHHSVLEWDFYRYTISSALRNFHPISFSKEIVYKQFLQSLSAKNQMEWKSIFKIFNSLTNKVNIYGEENDKFIEMTKGIVKTYITNLPLDVQSDFTKYALPHIEEIILSKKYDIFQPKPIAKWIFKRVFDLGWDIKLHGEFDSNAHEQQHRSSTREERIGKKYQWIAFHEAIAVIADNYYFLPDGRYKPNKDFFQGTWQLYLRDIDPTIISKKQEEGEIGEENAENTVDYDNWNEPISEWLNTISDMPNPKQYLLFKDKENVTWVNLERHLNWDKKELLEIEEHSYKDRQSMWHQARGYFVKSNNLKETYDWLKTKHFMGHLMPEAASSHRIFCRESYWSPAFLYEELELAESHERNVSDVWRDFNDEDDTIKGIPTTIDNHFEQDNSGSFNGFYQPHQLLFEKLQLHYGKQDGTFVNAQNEIVCYCPAIVNGDSRSFWIRQQDLITFLNENQLELIWTLLAKKQYHGESFARDYQITAFSGVYFLDKEKQTIEGNLKNFEGK